MISVLKTVGAQGLDDFIQDFYHLDGFDDTDYFSTLNYYGVDMSETRLDNYDVEHAGLDLLRAFITYCIRADRFCDDALASWVECGFIDRCMAGLKRLDGEEEASAKA